MLKFNSLDLEVQVDCRSVGSYEYLIRFKYSEEIKPKKLLKMEESTIDGSKEWLRKVEVNHK